MNRLASEASLYLRQHAANPVDWYPWGPEALARARERDWPIFLSVGYSACHWCHVMEHECFESPAIAQVLNDGFVCIKVDREERPDLDQIYMTAHHLLNQGDGGGWPLSVFLTPDLTPFYAGTYFPPDDRYAPTRPSFPKLLFAIRDAWLTKRDQLNEVGRQVATSLQGMSDLEVSDRPLTANLLLNAYQALKRNYDPVHGGFGHAPKFPHPLELKLLHRVALRGGADDAPAMVRHTLDKMARGGIYDQIGGGFHRYSVDSYWLVPHFEKMLYDNALLPTIYIEAFQLSEDPFYRQVACGVLDFVLREMTSPAGGFYSTLDADSEGDEGKFYVWSEGELESVLGPEQARVARLVYGTSPNGNFEGHNILFRSRTDDQDARMCQLSVEAFKQSLSQIQTKLYDVRSRRIWPGRDEKILTAWNGMMIGAMAQVGAVLEEPRYIESAVRAANYVWSHLATRTPAGEWRLFRTCGVEQPAKQPGFLEDYANLLDAWVTLYEATFDPSWIQRAIGLAESMLAHFADPAGGFYFTADDHEPLIARTKDLHDGAVPSGNAMAVTGLLRLAALTGRTDFRTEAERTLQAYHETMDRHPAAAGQMLIALDWSLGPIEEVVVIGNRDDPVTQQVLSALRRSVRPNRVRAYHDPASGPVPPELGLLANKSMSSGQVTTYFCRNWQCQAPLVGLEAIAAFG